VFIMGSPLPKSILTPMEIAINLESKDLKFVPEVYRDVMNLFMILKFPIPNR
jgi:hypothetical protein